MSNRKWNKGKPPHVGWWNASVDKSNAIWRWWDGKNWSYNAHHHMDENIAARYAKRKCLVSERFIEWTDYWPENARAPRINPDAKSEGVAR